MPSARIVASKSGFLTSLIFIWVDFFTIFSTAFLRLSISSPRFPIIIPGLDVYIETTKFSDDLSSSILLIEEFFSLTLKYSLTLRS